MRFLAVPAALSLALLVLIAASRLTFDPATRRWTVEEPSVFSGDEPHYLLVAHSVLFDHDLALGDDYARALAGGIQAGKRFRGFLIDHHTILVDPATGRHRLWTEIFNWRVRIGCHPYPYCDGFARQSPEFPRPERAIERSAHPVAFPVLAAALLWLTRPTPEQVEPRLADVNLLFCWLCVAFTWLAGRRAGLSERAAACAAALVLLASPWMAYGRVYFSEPLLGLATTAALWAYLGGRLATTGALLTLAVAVKPPLALACAGLLLERLQARAYRDAVRLGVAMAVGGVLLAAFNFWQARTLIIAGQEGWQGISSLRQLADTFVHQQHGLFRFVPWAIPALVGLFETGKLKASPPEPAHLVRRATLFSIVPLGALFMVFGRLGEDCYACRYWLPFLPWLAIVLVAWARGRRWRVGVAVCCGVLGLAIAVPGALLGRNAWNQPPAWGLSQMLDRP